VSVAAPLVAAAVLVLAICIWAQSHAASVQDWAKGGG
jgi:hypothetical protein